MAALFACLLGIGVSSFLYFYLHVREVIRHDVIATWAAIIAVISVLLVICISFFISIFVVKRINHIASTAVSIMNTGDLTQRIQMKTGWDDLSNLALVLNNLFQTVEALMRDVKSVSDNIAHDLRTPLTRLYNHLQILHQEYQRNETKAALTESEHLLKIFHALLRITHLEHGKQQLFRRHTAIDQLIQDACALYEPIFEKKKIEFFFDMQVMDLFIDRDMMFQVFVNILDNAINHAQNNQRIDIIGKIFANNYVVEFRDYGMGVTASARDKLFDRFYQAEESRSRGGSGLGLALVKAIILRHEGEVFSEATIPQGLTIKIKLPI